MPKVRKQKLSPLEYKHLIKTSCNTPSLGFKSGFKIQIQYLMPNILLYPLQPSYVILASLELLLKVKTIPHKPTQAPFSMFFLTHMLLKKIPRSHPT